MDQHYVVFDDKTGENHGAWDTLEEAKGCVEYDGLRYWQIWRGDVLVESYGYYSD